jgi:ATP-dependent Clp protease adaptor protein ClpS
VLHNDDINGFDYVVGVLRKVFNYGRLKAFWLTLKAHVTGRSIVWAGSLEVAELKADQLRSCGPDPNKKHRGAPLLGVSVEPLPG